VQSGAHPPSPIRSVYTLADASSKRVRLPEQRALLAQRGGVALVVEVQGDLTFAAAEIVTRRLCDAGEALQVAVVDLCRVDHVRSPAVELLRSLALRYEESGTVVALSGAERHPEMFEPGPGIAVPPYVTFEELDAALEWAEDLVLQREGVDGDRDVRVELCDHPFLAGLDQADLDVVVGLLEARRYDAGELIMQAGAPAEEMLLLSAGRVSSLVPRADGTERRLASFGSGSLVGELALLGDEPRMVNVYADTDLECHALTVDGIVALGALRPEARVVLFANMLRIVSSLADKLRDELALLGE
ncbi:MAG: cyclic nucleotide-binding domain-containing protein, partial [Actinomycetota bacterium]|nr:cyclic nucleotide-binding domain-containing protein [Actinomycetota bacterium]